MRKPDCCGNMRGDPLEQALWVFLFHRNGRDDRTVRTNQKYIWGVAIVVYNDHFKGLNVPWKDFMSGGVG